MEDNQGVRLTQMKFAAGRKDYNSWTVPAGSCLKS